MFLSLPSISALSAFSSLVVLVLPLAFFGLTKLNIYCNNYIIGVPTYIPFSFFDWLIHFSIFLSAPVRQSLIEFNHQKKKFTVYGFSARNIFHSLIDMYTENNQKLNVLTTPVHHKSFIKILENNPNVELKFIDLTSDYKNLIITQKTVENIKWCDVILITDLFGLSFDLKQLISLKNYFGKTLILDSITGGRSSLKENQDIDIDIYSTGQDKRPVAMGGAYCKIKDSNTALGLAQKISNLPLCTKRERLKKLLNTLLIQKLYTSHTVISLYQIFLNLTCTKFSDFITDKRKSNPGFEHEGYMKRPSNEMIQSIKYEIEKNSISNIEEEYIKKWKLYLQNMNFDFLSKHYPFYIGESEVVLPYNQILIHPSKQDHFLNWCDVKMIACMENQNYCTFQKTDFKYHFLCNSIMNIVTVMGTNKHTVNLAQKLKTP